MFFLLVLFLGLGGLQAGLKPRKTFLQTTVPEKISSSDTERDPENNVAYRITIKEKPYFVHLKKQSFLSPHSVVYSYDKYGTQKTNHLLDQMDCSYNGYIAGIPNSLVSLNTCSGLRGTLQLKNISYGIEPMEIESEFMHMIYEDKNYYTNISLLGDSHAYNNSKYRYRQSSERAEFFKLLPQYIEMYIVVDKNLFDYMGSDIKTVTQKIIQIIGFVNTMLTQLKLTVVISSIEIWSNKNKISTFGTPNSILFRFLEWKSKHVFQHYHIAYLLVFKKNINFQGAMTPGKTCDKDAAAGVAVYSEGLSLESYTVSIVQLLGLSMGMSFDNTDTCYCSEDVCTMSPKAIYSQGVKDFSACSLDEFKYFASNSSLECLHNTLPVIPVYKAKPKSICGNGLLESGEQCDCGTVEKCTHKRCCDPTLCILKGKPDCGSGECCTTSCKLKPEGKTCREPADEECDFPEFCNGRDGHCPPDTFKRNGEYCDEEESFCYKGRCRIFDKQCEKLFGKDSKGAQFLCYDDINARKDRYGNCGHEYCSFPNAMCGKLVCTWPHKKLVNRANLSVTYTHLRDQICLSAFKVTDRVLSNAETGVSTPEERDETYVEDGSPCGPDMYCIKFICREILHNTKYNVCNKTVHCQGNGVCNNFDNCHCKKGYAPPDCKEQKGGFGSINDGHPLSAGKSLLVQRSTASPKRRFQLIFYISLPVLIIIAAVLIKQNKIRELCYRGETGSERSVSEEGSNNSKLSLSVSNSL